MPKIPPPPRHPVIRFPIVHPDRPTPRTMRPSTKPGPVATFVTLHEARKFAHVNRYGK